MSEELPGHCRSADCDEDAEFYMEIDTQVKRDHWNGEFCYLHAMRVLDIKITEIDDRHPRITIERIYRDEPKRHFTAEHRRRLREGQLRRWSRSRGELIDGC